MNAWRDIWEWCVRSACWLLRPLCFRANTRNRDLDED